MSEVSRVSFCPFSLFLRLCAFAGASIEGRFSVVGIEAGIELCEEFFDSPDLFSGHILFLGPFYVFSSSSRLVSL